jgi:diguanylate cyclase (GGDEF)-like protein
MVLPDTSVEEGVEIANQLMDCVGALSISGLRNTPHPPITLSVGIAPMTLAGIQTTAELIKESDRAMMRAKTEGRNRVVVGES